MIDVIYIGLTGLNGYQLGLRVIANDAANLNTPGFKSSSLQFADLFLANGRAGAGYQLSQYGYGLTTLGTRFDFKQGQMQSTGRDLDLAVDGAGLFVVRNAAGEIRYTRDGQFTFDSDGVLVTASGGDKVMAFQDGSLVPVEIGGLRLNAAKATQNVTFSGNLSSTATSASVGSVVVIDKVGASHTLTVKLTAVSGAAGTWDATVLDGTNEVGKGQIAFLNGQPDPARSKLTMTYAPAGQSSFDVTLDFSKNVTSYDTGTRNTIAMLSQDGYAPGNLTATAFDESGVLTLTYSNGQKVTGARLALARFGSPDAVGSVGANLFEAVEGRSWQTGVAGDEGFGAVKAGMVETSNVDLSDEFADLVIMQRGYQASSQVISTANDMLAELFGMRGSR